MWKRKLCVGLVWSLSLLRMTFAGEDAIKNIVVKIDFEEVKEWVVGANEWLYDAIDHGSDFGQEGGPIVVLPSAFSMLCGGGVKLKVVEGTPGKEVHSGRRAILLNGTFYLGGGKAQTGDIFKAGFYAKGKGKARCIFYVSHTDGAHSQLVPDPALIETNEWILVEQTLDTSKEEPKCSGKITGFWIRLETAGDIYLDDLVVTKAVTNDSLVIMKEEK